jgi:group I intron endonuclease
MFVYLITCTVNGKKYVGITKSDLATRWRGHRQCARMGVKTALYNAIRKHGADRFVIRVLATATTRKMLCALERAFIVALNTRAPNGYNLTAGGDGTSGMSPETRAIVSEKNRGRKHTDEVKRLISEAGRGRKHSPESREKISKKHVGKVLSEEHRRKMSEAAKRRAKPKRTPEHIAAMHDGLRRANARRKLERVEHQPG